MCDCEIKTKRMKGFSKYIITSKGKIYSDYRKRYLSIKAVDKSGYLKVSIKDDNNIRKTLIIHKLIMYNFYGKTPKNKVIDHKDMNKHNNCICNLRFVSLKENSFNKFKQGCIGKSSSKRFRFQYYIKREAYVKYFDTYKEARTMQIIYQSLQKVFNIRV